MSNTSENKSILKKDGVSYLVPFILITFCFALWGFANDITNPMVKAFSKIFRMSVTDGTLVQVAFYGGYFAMAFPAAMFIRKYTYKAGVMMGLDVHDMENLGEVWVGYDGQPKSTQFGRKSLRLARKLEPGFVLTIEPGIYFIPELMDYWKAEHRFTDFINYEKLETYRDFTGLRNEEDYLITATGARRLGKKIPLTTEEVEAMR